MTYFIEPQDELAVQVLPILQALQETHGPETMVSPRGQSLFNEYYQYDHAVIHCVAFLENADDMGVHEWGYVPVWQWLEEYFCDH